MTAQTSATATEMEQGARDAAGWRHWIKVCHPLPYCADEARMAERKSEEPDPRAGRRAAQLVTVELRRTRDGITTAYRLGDAVPAEVGYLVDARGNLWVRWAPGVARWWRVVPDPYDGSHPDGVALAWHPYSRAPAGCVWVPPVHSTESLLCTVGPLCPPPAGLITADDRQRIAALRPATLRHRRTLPGLPLHQVAPAATQLAGE